MDQYWKEVNYEQTLWNRSKEDITEEEYQEFYSIKFGDDEDLFFVDDDDGGYEKDGKDYDNPTVEILVWASILPNISSVRASISVIMRIVSSFLLLWR